MARGDLWFKFYPADYLRATRGLSLEQRGAYMDSIAMQMERGGALEEDYAWLGHQMHVSPRKARAIVEELIALKKLERTEDGTIANERCLREIETREKQRKAASEAASERENSKRENSVKPPRNIRETIVKNQPNVCENLKNYNNFNGSEAETCQNPIPTRARLRIEEEKEEDNTPCSPPDGGADAGFEVWARVASEFGLAPCRSLSQARRAKMAARLKACGGAEQFENILRREISNSPFLRGRTPPRPGQRPFKAHVDFVLQRDSWDKLVDGFYSGGKGHEAEAKKAVQEAPQAREMTMEEISAHESGMTLEAYREAIAKARREGRISTQQRSLPSQFAVDFSSDAFQISNQPRGGVR